MTKIDNRKNYYIVLDTETCGNIDNGLVYDLGFAVVDKKGNVYETKDFVIYEIYVGEKELMKTAYYANKLPQYEEELKSGIRKMVKLATAKKELANLCKKYNVKAIVAHNGRFDYKSLKNTIAHVSNGTEKYFYPYGVEMYDTMKMAQDTICKQKTYIRYCNENGYTYGKNNRVRATAEIIYRYITGNNTFEERHTGLSDVMIEKDIFAKCLAQHKKMRKLVFAN
jgi:DNA polymerase III epsilon subunit-like protein